MPHSPQRQKDDAPLRLPRPIDDVLLAVVFMLCGIGSLFMTSTSLHHWSLAPLLFLGLCGAGAVFLGRAITNRQRLKRAADPEAERHRQENPSPFQRALSAAQGWIILLGCSAAYILCFLPIWGPLTLTKVLIALALFVGLGISFDVGTPPAERPRRRRGYVPGRHAARASRRWPLRRRCVAVASGLLLLFIGNWQWLGYSVEIRYYPLISHLCWIVSCAFGAGLVGVGFSASGRPTSGRLAPPESPLRAESTPSRRPRVRESR